jgi:hypothetical protein
MNNDAGGGSQGNLGVPPAGGSPPQAGPAGQYGGAPVGAAQGNGGQQSVPPGPAISTSINGNIGNGGQQSVPPGSAKKGMDPKVKKRIILWSCIGGGVIVLGVVAAIVLPVVFRVDYAETYRLAKEVKPKVAEIGYDNNCENVVDDVDDEYVTEKLYNEYVAKCEEMVGNIRGLIEGLAKSSAVEKDGDVKKAFEAFEKEVNAVEVGDDVVDTLAVWKAWHKYILGTLSASTVTDAQVESRARILIDSGNEALKKYGEGWKEKCMVYVVAYREYNNYTRYDAHLTELRNVRDAAKNELDNYVSANAPDVGAIAPFAAPDTSRLVTTFNSFYEVIRVKYQKNYNEADGLCAELLGIVSCS